MTIGASSVYTDSVLKEPVMPASVIKVGINAFGHSYKTAVTVK